MPVYDQYATTAQQNNTYGVSQMQEGFVHVVTFEKPTDTTDLSVFRLIKVPTSFIPTAIVIKCDAITGCTDVDLGAYKSEGGAVIDKDILADGLTLASARRVLDGTGIVNIDSLGTKTLAELLGYTAANAPAEVDLALTMNTAGSTAGTITVEFNFKRR